MRLGRPVVLFVSYHYQEVIIFVTLLTLLSPPQKKKNEKKKKKKKETQPTPQVLPNRGHWGQYSRILFYRNYYGRG